MKLYSCQCGKMHTSAFSVAVYHCPAFNQQTWGSVVRKTGKEKKTYLACKFENKTGKTIVAVYDGWWRLVFSDEHFRELPIPAVRRWAT